MSDPVELEKVTYSREELELKPRPRIRELATETWGMDSHDSKSFHSAELLEWILEQQEDYMARTTGRTTRRRKPAPAEEEETPKRRGRRKKTTEEAVDPGDGEEETPKRRGRARRSLRETSPEETPRGRARRGRAKTSKVAESSPEVESGGEVGEKVDAVGRTIDENHEEIKTLLEGVNEVVSEFKSLMETVALQEFVNQGLLADMYADAFGDDEVDSRISELEAEFNSGNE